MFLVLHIKNKKNKKLSNVSGLKASHFGELNHRIYSVRGPKPLVPPE